MSRGFNVHERSCELSVGNRGPPLIVLNFGALVQRIGSKVADV